MNSYENMNWKYISSVSIQVGDGPVFIALLSKSYFLNMTCVSCKNSVTNSIDIGNRLK